MSLRAIILDDEPHCLETLSWQLEQYCPEIELVTTFSQPLKALAKVAQLNVDVVFLDVEMPRINGFDWLMQIEDVDFEVVFTTAYDDFAIRAFQVSAFDYLLKPIRKEPLQATVGRLVKKSHSRPHLQQLDILMNSLASLQNSPQSLPVVALPTLQGLEFFQVKEIVRIESDNNYTWLYFEEGSRKLVTRTMKEMEAMLSPHNFLRVHNSHTVNLLKLKQYIRGDGGFLVLSDGTSVPVSRSRKEELLKVFEAS